MKRLVLTERDVELFHWLWMLRVLTLSQVRRLRYYQPDTGRLSSPDNVRKRVARLVAAGFLTPVNILAERSMRCERILFLGSEALAPLRHRYGIRQRRVFKTVGASLDQVHHALWVSEFAVRIVEGLRTAPGRSPTGTRLRDLKPLGVPFYHTHAVGNPSAKRHTKRFVTQEDLRLPGHPMPVRIRPDLVFALERAGACQLYFLEADRGFETADVIAHKLLAYHHYSATNRWRAYCPAVTFRVLIVTTTRARIQSLRAAVEHLPGSKLAAFSVFGGITTNNPVFDSLWLGPDGTGRPLIRRDAPGGVRPPTRPAGRARGYPGG